MTLADILRSMADKLEKIEGGGPTNSPELTVHSDEEDHDDHSEKADASVMMPPLQQKLEILKKSAGMDNAFDAEKTDELDDIKKLTGINAVIQQEASEDNDITG